MLSLETDLIRLRTLVDTAKATAPMRTGFLLTLLADLDAELATTTLTAEEQTLANVTVERLQIEEQLDDYIVKAFAAYVFETGKQVKPDWLKTGKKTEAAAYTAFFAEIANQAGITARMEREGLPTLAALQTLYTREQELAAKEDLKSGAALKIRKRWDIRALLIGVLRYLGRSGGSLGEAVTPAA